MSVPSKSIDKNKRYAGVKANDFVNKARTNETSRAAARTQGWANLGKINSRRIPPPANLPSLKSETGTNVPLFDPTIPTGTSHGWTASGNQTPTNLVNNQTRPLTPSKQPTQQQLDSLPAHVSTPPPQIPSSSSSTLSTDIDKPRGSTTWSTITAGNTTGNSNDQPPNLLGLNDFPRLVTQDNKNIKSQSDSLINSMSTTQGPSFRPANLASWKEGGGRAQPMSNDLIKESNDNNNNLSTLSMQSQILPTNANTSLLQSQIQNPNNSSYMRMYQQQQQQPPQQMWSYNLGNSYGPYGTNQVPAPMSMHQLHQQQQRISQYGNNAQSQSQQRLNTSTDYKTPTILRNKDIDDLSKLTDNVTWASASQEVNYEEKIRFSDDEDNDITDNNTNKPRRFNNSQQQQSKQTYPQVLQNNNNNRTLNTNYSQQQTKRSRLLQDDEHVKQMQDDKNSELINTLTVAKQRRDEQERNLRDTLSQRSTTVQKSFDDQKQIPGYQTRPLITSTGQDNLTTSSSSSPQIDSTSLWGQQSNTSTTSTSRPRHDTADSQTFAMKSWSDQMDSFNYASLHEKSGGQVDTDDHHDDTTVVIASGSSASHKYSRSQSESSTQSQTDNGTTINRSKHFLLTNRKQLKSNINQMKTSLNNNRTKIKTTNSIDYFDNNNNEQQIKSNDQWGNWEDTNNRYQQSYTNDRRRGYHQQNLSDDLSQKSNRHNEQTNDFNRTKQTSKARSNVSRSSDIPTSTKSETKTVTNKTQPAWRPLSPARPLDSNDPTPQESASYKPQININDRRQSAPLERKQRYTPINTASIPPLMSVRSDVPPTSTTTSKQYKTSNQLQRQDYNSSSHYSQRNDFYNETNDSTWGNDDEYYDDETGYYDPNIQTHQRHQHTMGYHSNIHHRGYIALGSYGRYRRGGTLRHQQQYNTYNMNNTSGLSSQLNTSTGSKTKKPLTNRTTTTTVTNNKKSNESSEQQTKNIVEPSKIVTDEVIKKPSAWTTEQNSTPIEEISKTNQPIETSSNSIEVEKPKESIINITSEQKNENEPNNLVGQTDTESTITNKKPTTTTTTTTNLQRKTNKDQQNYHQDQRYQNQQVSHHRNTYGRSMQDYDAVQMNAHNYYGTSRRTTRGGRNTRMHDLSGGYYYEHPQQRYNSRYNYLNEHYQQHPTHSTNKTTKRTGSSTITADRQQHKQQTTKGNNNNNNNNTNLRPQSASDNEQKEGEEWETASESSANMRSTHTDTNQQQSIKSTTNETKSTDRDRTPPKKSFSSQRPLNSRYNESSIYRRPYNIHERGSKTSRTIVHRTNRLSTNLKQNTQQKTDGEIATTKQTSTIKKDQHRHSLEGYDLNNVAGVVKIETLPASALEEESSTFDDGGEEFCVVMSKRGRKEQKAAQLSKQNAIESTNNTTTNIINDQTIKSTSTTNDEQQTNEKISNETNQTNTTRTRNGKSIPPRFNSKTSNSTIRQHNIKNDHQNSSMYYYDQNYYYHDQNQYYDQSQYYDHDNSYYNYGNYNQSHRQQTSTRRKQRIQQNNHDIHTTDEQHLNERQKNESNISEKNHSTSSSSNVMSNIQMWDPHTDNTISNSSKLIEKPTHDRKFGNELVPSSSSNDPSLPLHQRTATDLTTHSTVSKANETIARTIKPPITDNKSTRDNKTKSTTYEKTDAISSLGSNQLFEKSTFLDYDDKQSIGTVGDDYNQKINSLKTIWDASEHPSVQLEQTINTMVAMKQKQKQSDNNISNTNSTKTDNYVQESKSTSSTNITVPNTNVSSTANDDTNNKITTSTGNLQSTGSSSTINQPPSTYSTNTVTSKNEQKNICTVKPTQQVAPNIQDQVDVTSYQTFAAPPLVPPISQTSLQQQQQHILPQSQVNPLHQQHSYQFYENLLPAPPPPQIPQQQPPPQQQQQFNRYPPQNFPYRNTNVFLPPPNVPNTNSMYHHTSQGSISAPPQNNAMPPPPMTSYPSPFLVDHGGHMISQPQPPPQAYMNNQMMSGRPQGTPYYRTPPQQQLQTPPAPPYGTQDPLAHGGFYPQFYQPPPNSNAPPVGHPSPHNLYGQNEGFHPAHPQMFARAGSIDRNDHPLMSQPPQSLSRPTNYPSTSSNQQQQGPPPSLLSQNLKSFHTNQQQTSSSNQAPFYPPPPNQYTRQPMPIGAMNTTNNRQQTQQVPSLMSGLSKNFSSNTNNLNNTQSLFQHRQPLIPSQSNNNRPLYQHHTTPYSNYSKSTGPNDDNIKPKHI
ncbi:unnamed protein product [Rotaria sordida]|uniref:Uncharacterized protein n=1 Tax=Rotaria sordida TaxID=392033 RepID=A0A814NRH8_9BILA|nr:unnamed protein product [Rotaria sordida]CAF1425517.1 unnamed protein product [Rotaria sordida]